MKNWQRLKQDPQFRQQLLLREQVIDATRTFFKARQYHEVETPLLVSAPGAEPYLNLFTSKLELPYESSKNAYLLTSPEYAMKKLLAANMGSIFQICKSFRNRESLGGTHNPEFTILEFYKVKANYLELMTEFEDLLRSINGAITGQETSLTHQGKSYDLSQPFVRLTVAEAFAKYLHLTADELLDVKALSHKAMELGYATQEIATLPPDLAWEELYNQLFLNEIETKIAAFDQPVIIFDYPAPQAALARKKTSDPRFAERFEVYLGGMELGNAFGELLDAAEQKARLEADLVLRQQLGKPEQPIDYDFITALQSGMPECSGMAVGMDRLIMLWADATEIDEVLFFPASQMF